MSQQILHGNVQEKYWNLFRDVPKSWIKAEVDRATESFLGDDPVPNRSLVRLETPEGSKLMYTVCRRKENAESRSYFVHKQVFPCDGADLLNNFVQILTKPFFTEEEFDRIACGEEGVQPTSRLKGMSVGTIHPEVLRAVLYGIVGRWWAASAPVCISVPLGVDYDSYCGTIINTIYQYLPVGIRAQAGFMTYAIPDASLIDVALYFMPADEWGGQIQISAENPTSRELLKTQLPPVLKSMIDKLLDYPVEAERRDCLRRIYEGIEAGTDIGRISSKSYEQYLQVMELDADMAHRQNFDRLNEAFADFDRCSKNVQAMLLQVLADRVDTRVLDMHLLTLPKRMGELPTYVTELEAYAHMLRHSTELSEHVRQTLVKQFAASVAASNNLTGLNYLGELLSQMEQSPGYFLNNTMLALMRKTLETARRAPLDVEINKLICNALENMKALAKETKLTTLIDRANKIENDLSDKLHKLDAEYDFDKACTELRKERALQISRWHHAMAEGLQKRLPENLTQKDYQSEQARLDHWIKQYPDHKAYYQKVLDELNSRYHAQGLDLERDLKQSFYEESDYFRALEALYRCINQYKIPKQDWQEKYYPYVMTKRPLTLKEYQRAYENRFGKKLSVNSLMELPHNSVRTSVWRDLQKFYENDRCVDVRNADITLVLDDCIRVHEFCRALNVPKRERVILLGETRHEYDSLLLQNTLWWFLGGDAKVELLSLQDMAKLMTHLGEMALTPEQMLQILDKLLSAKANKDLIGCAVTMLVKKEFDQYQQHFRAAEKLLDEFGYSGMYRDIKRSNSYHRGGIIARVAHRIVRMKRNFSLEGFLQEAIYWLCMVLLFIAMYQVADRYLMPDVKPEVPTDSFSVIGTASPESGSANFEDYYPIGQD